MNSAGKNIKPDDYTELAMTMYYYGMVSGMHD